MALLCWTSRWGTSTKAMPGSAGMREKKRSNASSPPAEAPIPTIGSASAPRRPRLRLDGEASEGGISFNNPELKRQLPRCVCEAGELEIEPMRGKGKRRMLPISPLRLIASGRNEFQLGPHEQVRGAD